MPRKFPRPNYPLDLGPPELERRERWTRAATHDGYKHLSEWIRDTCDTEAEEIQSTQEEIKSLESGRE